MPVLETIDSLEKTYVSTAPPMLDVKEVGIFGFGHFLQENLEEEMPGRNTEDCPLAKYLRKTFNNNGIKVGLTRAYQKVGFDEHTVMHFKDGEEWMEKFVRHFDEKHDKVSQLCRKATGADAFVILDYITRYYNYDSNSLKSNEKPEAISGEDTSQNLQG